MMNVISSEIYKIFKNKIFYALISIFLLMNAACFYSAVREKINGVNGTILDTGFHIYGVSYNEDGIFYLILIFVAFLITSEYANGTIRQMACRGINRRKIVIGQYIAMSIILAISIFAFGIINLVIMTLFYELGTVDIAAFIRMNFGLLCMILGTTAIGTFLSYLIKNVGVTILASISIITVSKIAMILLVKITGNETFMQYAFTNMRKTIVDFSSNPQDVIRYSILFLVMGLVSIVLSGILFSKKDVN